MRLTPQARQVLSALVAGATLKSHRYLDGTKLFRLHTLSGDQIDVRPQTVQTLVRHGLVTSNQKFPAATYTLTPAGRTIAAAPDPR